MQKRGIADLFHFGNSDNDQSLPNAASGDWNLILTATNAAAQLAPLGSDFAFLHAGAGTEVHFGTMPIFAGGSGNEDASGAPDAATAGGKKTTGGRTTSGGGTTSDSGSGTTSTGQGTTTTALHDVPIH
jgi:hypothetical protein